MKELFKVIHCFPKISIICGFFSVQKLQLFQGQMEEIDARLVEAEQVKSNWTPVQDLVIDSLSEQMDDLKVTIATVLITYCDLLFVSISF